MIRDRSWGYRAASSIIQLALILSALICLAPIIHAVAMSLSSSFSIGARQVSFWPVGANTDNYRYIVQDQQFVRSFVISVFRVIAGLTTSLLIIVVTAYPLSLDDQIMPGRNTFKIVMLFGMLFSGGLIPYFLALKNIGLLNKFAVLVIPPAFNIFYTIVVINFFRGIPRDLSEAAMIDGASHLDILFQVYLPISLPVLATISLFSAVGHWNSWFDGIVFLNTRTQWPLQSYLYTKVIADKLYRWGSLENIRDFREATPEGMATAMIILATAPIMLVYPFLQRYFVTGLTLGSVKG